jgi:hypothetical protein
LSLFYLPARTILTAILHRQGTFRRDGPGSKPPGRQQNCDLGRSHGYSTRDLRALPPPNRSIKSSASTCFSSMPGGGRLRNLWSANPHVLTFRFLPQCTEQWGGRLVHGQSPYCSLRIICWIFPAKPAPSKAIVPPGHSAIPEPFLGDPGMSEVAAVSNLFSETPKRRLYDLCDTDALVSAMLAQSHSPGPPWGL